jgi:hypothetical protein
VVQRALLTRRNTSGTKELRLAAVTIGSRNSVERDARRGREEQYVKWK